MTCSLFNPLCCRDGFFWERSLSLLRSLSIGSNLESSFFSSLFFSARSGASEDTAQREWEEGVGEGRLLWKLDLLSSEAQVLCYRLCKRLVMTLESQTWWPHLKMIAQRSCCVFSIVKMISLNFGLSSCAWNQPRHTSGKEKNKNKSKKTPWLKSLLCRLMGTSFYLMSVVGLVIQP